MGKVCKEYMWGWKKAKTNKTKEKIQVCKEYMWGWKEYKESDDAFFEFVKNICEVGRKLLQKYIKIKKMFVKNICEVGRTIRRYYDKLLCNVCKEYMWGWKACIFKSFQVTYVFVKNICEVGSLKTFCPPKYYFLCL